MQNIEAQTKDLAPPTFPIVAIGASSGGLKPLIEILQNLPVDTGMAFIIVQHLSPNRESMMSDIFSRATKMQIHEISDGMAITPNCVYVMPENAGLSISGGILKILSISEDECHRLPIDHFFQALAKDFRNKIIGIVLSGAASDGSLGLMAIKEAGGITFAQDEDSAEYKSMPQNAIATGFVDFVCPPKAIADKLIAISRHPYNQAPEKDASETAFQDASYLKILKLLHEISSVNLTNYKYATIKRRIVRRMVLKTLETLNEYVTYLERNPDELKALLQDVLIHVTEFFRDPEMYESLKTDVFPLLIKNKDRGTPIRMWIVGCSTGEEAYSFAIAFVEFLGERLNDFPIQIFATDANDYCIEVARKGLYRQGMKFNISNERLRRFFIKAGDDYQIIKSIRDVCVFAKQNILADPPYSKMDLISCRNLLIYFDPILQKKALSTFHYALRPEGFLILGKAESIESNTDLFQLLDKKTKIHSKKLITSKNSFHLNPSKSIPEKFPQQRPQVSKSKDLDVFKEADQAILSKFEHAGVIINEKMEILQFRGDTSPFLNNAPGTPSANLFKMAREGLGAELHTLIQKAREEGTATQKKGARVKHGDKLKEVLLEAFPLKLSSGARYFLILFAIQPAESESIPLSDLGTEQDKKPELTPQELRSKELEEELAATKVYLTSIISDRDSTNLELQSSNEEAQSSNEEAQSSNEEFQSMIEELQSTNEELETAKEELQATNEEMITINDELQTHISQLTLLSDDLGNLLTSIHLSIIMIDRQLCIRRFTKSAERIFHLLPTDIGRPITDLTLNIKLPIDSLILEVITTSIPQEQEAQDDKGKWFLINIRPYKTSDNKINGAIVIMTDIDELKKSHDLLATHKIELETSNQELEQFAYIASHDLQEPLRMVSMYLDLLKTSYRDKLEKDAREFIAFAKEGAERCEKMIRDLLQYARVSTKGLSPVLTDFESILKRTLLNLKLAVLESGADITHDPLPQILADSFQMTQLFQNLLSNAIKYRSGEMLKIHISAKEQENDWLFSIKDNGIGIDAHYKDLIFAIFQRLHTTDEHPGSGIGLSICKKIVERHCGKIWMESRPGEGTTFYFTLAKSYQSK